MRSPALNSHQTPRLRGFTLVELLIVIAILAVLFAFAVAAMAPLMESARIAATKATIAQLSRMVEDRLNAFQNVDLTQQAKKKMTDYVNGNNTSPSSISKEVAVILVQKDRYKAAFPQYVVDLYGFNGMSDSGRNDDAPLLQYWMDSPANGTNVPSTADNAELLYLFLTKGEQFGLDSADIDRINPAHVGDTDGDGRLEFLDAWGNPLRFYNAPTQLIKNPTVARVLIASLPSALGQDPFDPLGRIANSSNYSSLAMSGFQIASEAAQAINAAYYYDNNTWFSFLIVSCGPDGELGLGEPSPYPLPDPPDSTRLARPLQTDHIYDNLTNRQQ